MTSTVDRIRDAMAGIREAFADRYISIGESIVHEYDPNDSRDQRVGGNSAISGESSRSQGTSPACACSSSGNSSKADSLRKGLPTLTAISPKVIPSGNLWRTKSTGEAPPIFPLEPDRVHLSNSCKATDRHVAALHGRNPTQQRQHSQRTRSVLHRSITYEIKRFSVTPPDLIYPMPAFIQDRSFPETVAAQTFGLHGKGYAADEEHADEEHTPLVLSLASKGITDPPDGGRLAWATACSGFLVTFNCWGYNTAFGIFDAYYVFDLLRGTSPSKVAWIGSIQLFMLFFLGTPIGLAMDRGWFRPFFNGGSGLLVASIFLTSFCTEWWHLFLVQGLLSGISAGMVFCSGTIVLMTYFKRRIGIAMALAAAGSSVGAIIYSVTFQRLVNTHGFAWTMRILGVIALITMLIPNLIVRPRRGIYAKKQSITWSAWNDFPYWLMALGLFFSFWGVFFGFYYIVSYGIEHLALSGSQAVNLLIAMCAANLPGRLIPGLISDRCIGPLNTIIPSCILSAMMIFLWIGVSTHSALIVVASFYGFAAAGIQALYAPTIHSFAHSDPATMGQKTGMVFTVISLACLTGAPIGGALIDAKNGEYLYAQLFAGTCLVAGGALLLVARVLKVGWSGSRA